MPSPPSNFATYACTPITDIRRFVNPTASRSHRVFDEALVLVFEWFAGVDAVHTGTEMLILHNGG